MNRALAHLTAARTSFVIALDGDVPRVVHWGAAISDRAAAQLAETDLTGVSTYAPDRPRTPSIVPTPHDGWSGLPGLEAHRDGLAIPLRPVLASAEHDGSAAAIRLDDDSAGIRIEVIYRLDAHGVLSVQARMQNVSAEQTPVDLAELRILLPVPHRACEALDFTGRWSRERAPQRRPILHGSHLRQADRGKSSHDSPFVVTAGTEGFGFRRGELWAVHLAWSGASEHVIERLPEGAGAASSMLGAGEALAAGEIRLRSGESYLTPHAIFVWSDHGLDGVAERLHAHVRAFDVHPTTPRPITVNSWEAVYFEHDRRRIDDLVDRAARVGAERFVLDDGWFGTRDDDTTSLGDWVIDRRKWPEGLAPLSRRVHELGMQFGLWVEPEMISLDSDLAREHPNWMLAPLDRPAGEARHQQVLNLAHPAAFRYLHERISSLISEIGIDYLKWDHNRDLSEAVDRTTGRPGVHRQTLAMYALIDALRSEHPRLEIETCAGGGGRVDLGILERTHRIWTSDTLDPVERQRIQLWSTIAVPPELIGSHVGAERAHTTGRRTDLSFRLATALFGHSGIEWDLSECSDDELEQLAGWVALAKRMRSVIGTGRIVRVDVDDPEALLYAVVAPDGSHALAWWVRLGTSPDVQTGRIPLPGLCDDAAYRIRVCTELGEPRFAERRPAAWVDAAVRGDLVLDGQALSRAGLPWPVLQPAQALVLELTVVD